MWKYFEKFGNILKKLEIFVKNFKGEEKWEKNTLKIFLKQRNF